MSFRLEQKECEPCHDLMIMKTVTFDKVEEDSRRSYFLKEDKKHCKNTRKR